MPGGSQNKNISIGRGALAGWVGPRTIYIMPEHKLKIEKELGPLGILYGCTGHSFDLTLEQVSMFMGIMRKFHGEEYGYIKQRLLAILGGE